jgi:hypothetical protein
MWVWPLLDASRRFSMGRRIVDFVGPKWMHLCGVLTRLWGTSCRDVPGLDRDAHRRGQHGSTRTGHALHAVGGLQPPLKPQLDDLVHSDDRCAAETAREAGEQASRARLDSIKHHLAALQTEPTSSCHCLAVFRCLLLPQVWLLFLHTDGGLMCAAAAAAPADRAAERPPRLQPTGHRGRAV